MKKLIAMLALLAFTGNIASAELLKNFKYDGVIDVNAYSSKNNTDADDDLDDTTSDVDTRLQVNMAFDLNDDVDAVVSLVKENRKYGDTGTATGESVDNLTLNTIFEQAYLNLKGVFGLDHKLGRQYYGEQGDLVVYYGPQGWPYVPTAAVTALDSWTGWYKNDKWTIHAVAGKAVNDTTPIAVPEADTDLTGIVAKYMLNDDLSLGAYYYNNKTYAAASDTVLKVAGVKAMGKLAGFNYYGEYAKNMGQNGATAKYEGMALLAKADYGMDIAGKLTFMGEFAMGSGDDNSTDTKTEQFVAVNSDYRPGVFWGGFNANNGVSGNPTDTASGLTTWNIGAKWMPEFEEKLSLSAKYVFLAPTEDKLDGASIGYDEIGTELDLCASWQHSENVKIKAYYAYFMPEKNYSVASGNTKDDPAHVLGAALNVKF